MSKSTFLATGLFAATAIFAMAQKPEEKAAAPAAESSADVKDISHIIGSNIGRNMKRDGVEIDAAALTAGLVEALTDAKPKYSDEQAQQIMQKFQQDLMQKKTKMDAEKGAVAKKAGSEFLEKNGKREGVVTTKSGLQYEIVKKGEGAKPKDADTVKVHYHGTLTDGKVFDSSVDRGEPTTFPVNQVIKGWTEALQLMPVGSKWKLFIPSDLAYGEQGAPPDIAPHSTLIFEVELLGIEGK